MKTLRGRSGVLHTFDEVGLDAGVVGVMDKREDEANELDIISLYLKMVDVGAVSGEVVAPSFTMKARELAGSYGIRLKSKRDAVVTEY